MVTTLAIAVLGMTTTNFADDFVGVVLNSAVENKSESVVTSFTSTTPNFSNRHTFRLNFWLDGAGDQDLPATAVLEAISGGSSTGIEIGVRENTGTVGVVEGYSPKRQSWADGSGQSNANFITHSVLSGSTNYPICIAADGAISGTTLVIIVRRNYRIPAAGCNPETHHINWQRIEYVIGKLQCGDASVDSRQVYNDGNEVYNPATVINEAARSKNFSDWTYKGGLFVGKMPWASGDQSGIGRLQLTATSASTDPLRMVVLSTFYMGMPAIGEASMAIGAYRPDSGDTNLSTAEGDMTWTTRWESIIADDGSGTSYEEDPLSYLTIDDETPTKEYLNFLLTPDTSQAATGSIFKTALCLRGELGVTGPCWAYFASKEYQSLYGGEEGFPINDCKPRMWDIRIPTGTRSSWTQNL